MSGTSQRAWWIGQLERLARPLLERAATGRLRAEMPVEAQPGASAERQQVTHLEAIGRCLAGLAPWLELAEVPATERALQAEWRGLARASIAAAVDPTAADGCRFDGSHGGQPVVDAAFLAHALLRAPQQLAAALGPGERDRLRAALLTTREITPCRNNWLLFAAMVEAELHALGAALDRPRVADALRSHHDWYLGDGCYGDGPQFHWDYYNSFVIQPMLLDVLAAVGDHDPDWAAMRGPAVDRARRYAAIQERLIAPDGSYPPIGRSIVYRCGAFQHLAQAALQGWLPEDLAPSQVRCALAAVIARTLDAPGTYDPAGWLRIGLHGHQPHLGEGYISTGSLYLASTAFLPLGLPAAHPFWTGPELPWTARRVWCESENLPADHAL